MQVQSTLSPEERAELQMRSKLNQAEHSELAVVAAGSGKLECLKVLRNRFIFPNEKTWEAAAAAGHLDILQWLQEVRPGDCGSAVFHAACAGHRDCLSFLHGVNAHWDEFTASFTAQRGQLACLMFMVEQGCRLFPLITMSAAENGHIDCLQYLHAQGCPWDAGITRKAAAGGHLECLMFAVKKGCPVDDETLAAAVECGEEECLEYLLDCGFRPEQPLRILRLDNESLWDCFEVLERHGVDVSPGQIVYAASHGDLEVVRHFHATGFPLWHAAVDEFDDEYLAESESWFSWAWFVRMNSLIVTAQPQTLSIWDGVLHIPPFDHLLPACWATLRFGAVHGAPLTPRAQALVQERQGCAQEVVRCFHAARWLAAGGRRDSAKWAAMSRVPNEVLMTIMELAEVEIREALH
jgi:hypothetical protein